MKTLTEQNFKQKTNPQESLMDTVVRHTAKGGIENVSARTIVGEADDVGADYKIISSTDIVRVFTKKRIPFQPHDWCQTLRKELRTALSELKPEDDRFLTAYYYGAKTNLFDLENILFYNIGSSTFRQIAMQRIFAKFCVRNNAYTFESHSDFPCEYIYRLQNSVNEADRLEQYSVAAEWKEISIPATFGKNKPLDYWLALKSNAEKIHICDTIPGGIPFGIKIKLSVPSSRALNLAAVVKPLLDGTVCAFHGADAYLHENSELLASRIGVTAKQLLYEDNPILGKCRFLYPYLSGVKWNPQDDRCLSFEVETENSNDGGTYFSGAIYRLST